MTKKSGIRQSGLTPEQHALRAKGIGGSEIAAVAGLSPWDGPLDVYLSKTGQVEFDESNFHVKRGRHLEAGIISWYEEDTGLIVRPSTTLVHPVYEIVRATPDGVVSDGITDLAAYEAKSPARTDSHWGEPGTDEIPSYYVPQVMWEMAVLGLDRAVVSAVLHGERLDYEVGLDHHLFSDLVGIAHAFWHDHIVPRVPPDYGESKSAVEYVKKKYPTATNRDMTLSTPETDALVHWYHMLDYLEKYIKTRKESVKARLIEAIDSHAGLVGPFGKIRHGNSKGQKTVEWEALVRHLGGTDEDIAMFTGQTAGHRMFRPYWSGDEPPGVADLVGPIAALGEVDGGDDE